MEKPLGEIMPTVESMVVLQTKEKDVAIPYIVGKPGIGKTANIMQMCKRNDWVLYHLHIALKPIEEFSGIPIIKEFNYFSEDVSGTEWTLPDILKPITEMSREKLVLVFLDDIHLASPDHLSLCYELFTEKTLRGYPLPDNSAFILAGNDSSKAGAKTMFSAIVNRCAWLKVTPDLDAWKSQFAIPGNLNGSVIAFLTHDHYSMFANGEERVNEPWPSFRSWTRFAKLLDTIPDNFESILYFCTAHVGKEAASEFVRFYKLYRAVDVKSIFKNIHEYTVPDNPVSAFLVSRAVLDTICSKKSAIHKYEKVFTEFLVKMLKVHSEIGIALLKDLLLYEKTLKLKVFEKVLAVMIRNHKKIYDSMIADLKLV